MTNCNPCNKLKEYDPCDCITKQLIDECSGKTINYVTLASAVLMKCNGKETLEEEIAKIYQKITELGDITVSQEHFIQMLLAVKHSLLDLLDADIRRKIEQILEDLLANKFLNLLEFFMQLFNDWNARLEFIISSLSDTVSKDELQNYVNGAEWDSDNECIRLYNTLNPEITIASIPGSEFLIDGMIQSVVLEEGTDEYAGHFYLVFTFNTESEQEPIRVDIGDIFDPNNYYTSTYINQHYYDKDTIDALLNLYLPKSTPIELTVVSSGVGNVVSDILTSANRTITKKKIRVPLNIYTSLEPITNFVNLSSNPVAATLPSYSVITCANGLNPIENNYNIKLIADDINGDGKFDIADVNIVINCMLGKETNPEYKAKANLNGDEYNGVPVIDISDVNTVINLMLGKADYPVTSKNINNEEVLIKNNVYYNVSVNKFFQIIEKNNKFYTLYFDKLSNGTISLMSAYSSDVNNFIQSELNLTSIGTISEWTTLGSNGESIYISLPTYASGEYDPNIASKQTGTNMVIEFTNSSISNGVITATTTVVLDEYGHIVRTLSGELETVPQNAQLHLYTLTVTRNSTESKVTATLQ